MKYKICSRCKINKPHSDYHKDNGRAIGIRCKCKECDKAVVMEWRSKNKSEYNNYTAQWRAKNPDKQHATDIKRHYGLSIDEYRLLLDKQHNKCQICGKKHNPSEKRQRLYVDHDHLTGKVRGLLCANCNFIIGHADDKVELLQKAIAYLKS